jgi:thiol-disulfide isomerase/thioredoxin
MKNIKNTLHYLVIAIVIVTGIALLPSCDIVEEPYLIPVDGGTGPGPDEGTRNVLLEDFTGQKCPNCPAAAVIAHDLKAQYGERLVVLAIHAGFYSIPDATGDFTADMRTAEGVELNSYFSISVYGYPMGMVNRTEYNGFPVVVKDDWATAVEEQLALPAQAEITISNTYNAASRQFDCTLETEFLDNLEGTYNICAYITESGIISPQQTKEGINLTYEHNHMLRGSLNGTWGDLVGTDGLAVTGTVLTNHYSFTLPDGWNADNCEVVAFIYNTETFEVLQAEEAKLAGE